MEYYYERIKDYLLETYCEARATTDVRGVRSRRSYVLKHDRYILMFDFEELSTISKTLISALRLGDIWIISKAYQPKTIFEAVMSKPLLSKICNSEPSRKDGNYHISTKKLTDGILLLHTADNQKIEIAVGEINISA